MTTDYEDMILKDLFDVWNHVPVGQEMEPLNAENFVALLVARNVFHLIGAAVKSRNRAEHWARSVLHEEQPDPAEEEARIDALRLRAFRTNDPGDRQAYFEATSSWFQDRHYRNMAEANNVRF